MPRRMIVVPAFALALVSTSIAGAPAEAATVTPTSRAGPAAQAGAAFGTYSWPVRGPVIRGFQSPSSPYGSGHRGIDIGTPFGTEVLAPADGFVAFAGWVAGSLFLSIDHSDGVRTTYSWLSAVSVRKGEAVARGQAIARSGHGHPEIPTAHLHFGARVGAGYIDPMLLLEGLNVADLIHLAPLDSPQDGPARLRAGLVRGMMPGAG